MKKMLVPVCFAALLSACNNSGETPGQTLDTVLKKADTVTKKVGAAAETAWDSTKSKVQRLDDKVDKALHKDTAH